MVKHLIEKVAKETGLNEEFLEEKWTEASVKAEEDRQKGNFVYTMFLFEKLIERRTNEL